MILDYVALGSIIFLAIGITAAVVVTGSLPGKIARQRNHPWPDAVNVAGWIGLATGILWPLALVWAFLPVPVPNSRNGGQSETDIEPSGSDAQLNPETVSGRQSDDAEETTAVQSDRENFRQQIDALAKIVAELQSNAQEVDA